MIYDGYRPVARIESAQNAIETVVTGWLPDLGFGA